MTGVWWCFGGGNESAGHTRYELMGTRAVVSQHNKILFIANLLTNNIKTVCRFGFRCVCTESLSIALMRLQHHMCEFSVLVTGWIGMMAMGPYLRMQ